jgi:hypothetical protein
MTRITTTRKKKDQPGNPARFPADPKVADGADLPLVPSVTLSLYDNKLIS